MKPEKLQIILDHHKKWLADSPDGKRANLQEANLQGADLDFSCWPLWCGSKGVTIDRWLFTQLAAHLCAVIVDDEECQAAQKALLPLAKTSHREDNLL